MSKVVIVLEGGLVQSVYSDDKKIQVVVLDHDVYEDLYPKLDLDVPSLFRPAAIQRCAPGVPHATISNQVN